MSSESGDDKDLVEVFIAPIMERRLRGERYSAHGDYKRVKEMERHSVEIETSVANALMVAGISLPWVVVDARGACVCFATLWQAMRWSKTLIETSIVRGPFLH